MQNEKTVGVVQSVTSGLQPELVSINEVRQESPFKDLFRIQPAVLELITEDMRINGYDPTYPLLIGNGVLLDGHTRHQAARNVGIDKVWVVDYNLADVEQSLRVAIASQLDRRKLTDADTFRLTLAVDQALPPESGTTDEKGKKAPDKTVELIGSYGSKVGKVRYVNTHSTPEIRANLENGEYSLSQAARACREIAGKSRKRTGGDQPKFGRINTLLDLAIKMAKADELAKDLADLKVKCEAKVTAQKAAEETAKKAAKEAAKAAKLAAKSGQVAISKPVVKNCGKLAA